MDLSKLKCRVPFKWKPNNKVGSGNSTKFQCVGYLDARQVREVLDTVVGPENWASDFKEIKGNLYGGIGINVQGDKKVAEYKANPEWIWKWDCGTESNMDKIKGESSDAFKRAAVTWGVGAFLYELGRIIVPAKEYKNKAGKSTWYPADDKGEIIWDNDELGKFINKKYPHTTVNIPAVTPTTELPVIAEPEQKKDERYNTDKTGKYSTTNHNFSIETIEAVGKLKRDGKTGGQVLALYLSEYNKKYKKSYEKVMDIPTNEEMMEFVTHVKSLPPKDLS